MPKLLKIIEKRLRSNRPGSVLILVVALLVLMALMGTVFLSTSRVDRLTTVQHVTNTQADLLLDGVKNMAVATIVGSLNDPSLPFPYRPANSSIAKNWDGYDYNHQYTDDKAIATTPNDAWLSPRCPTDIPYLGPGAGAPALVWSCIGEPLTGNTFESPFVLNAVTSASTPANTGSASLNQANVPLTYRDRVTAYFVPPSKTATALADGNYNTSSGNNLTPTFATFNYLDGTSVSYPAWSLNVPVNGAQTPLTFLAGDADGDGIADCGMFKLPIGPIAGITYYAGVRIIDNCAAVNVNTALSRRYDFAGDINNNTIPVPTRYIDRTTNLPVYTGVYNLGCFPGNVGLAEMLSTYDGSANNYDGRLLTRTPSEMGQEFGQLVYHMLANPAASGVFSSTGAAEYHPVDDYNQFRTDFEFTTLGEVLYSQLARRPGNAGHTASNAYGLPASDTDEAALAYHFVFFNPNTPRSPLEANLHNSLSDIAPNGQTGPPRSTSAYLPVFRSTAYVGNASNAGTVTTGWYSDNFDWFDDRGRGQVPPNTQYPGPLAEGCCTLSNAISANAGINDRPRRSILTANSAVSNLVPRPALNATYFPPTVAGGSTISIASGMSPITSTMCKASVNTASFGDLWRAFWLSMTGDNGTSPLGQNPGDTVVTPGGNYTVPGNTAVILDHDLQAGQSVYTGNQFPQPTADVSDAAYDVHQAPADFAASNDVKMFPQHPQAMFRSPLRFPAQFKQSANVFYNPQNVSGQGTGYSYIQPDQMVLLRSAIAAANIEAMRDPLKGSGANIHMHDIPLTCTIDGAAIPCTARVFGVTQQPYITEVYVNTNIAPNADIDPTTGQPASMTGQSNAHPYVAIELFNPYNQPINLTGWQLALINRSPNPTAGGDTNRNVSSTSVIYTFGITDPTQPVWLPAYSSPITGQSFNYQGGYALLENYDFNNPGSNGVKYRPLSSNIRAPGTVSRASATGNTGAPVTDIFVSRLGEAIAQLSNPATAGYNSNQELVLLRPSQAGGVAETQIDQVPIDSFDFTGLTYDPAFANADVWHYVRENQVAMNGTSVQSNATWRFIYPGRYDATDPTPYAKTAFATTPAPTPGNPSGNDPSGRNYPRYTYSAWSRRQQGVNAAHWNPSDTVNPMKASDPTLASPPQVPVTLGQYTSTNFGPNDNYRATYPVTFAFQYLNTDEPGTSPLLAPAGVNAFPYGQFARNSDLMQVPFVGSYLILTTKPTSLSSHANGTASAPLGVGDLSAVAEVNPITMDCAFAEDTDTTDDPPGPPNNQEESLPSASSANHYVWNESVGHFAPVNTQASDNSGSYRVISNNPGQTIADSDPTLAYSVSGDPQAPYRPQWTVGNGVNPDTATQKYWRYRWASRIFDYLTVQAPSDDYFPNVQQSIYTQNGQPIPEPVQNTLSLTAANTTAITANPPDPTSNIPVSLNTEDTVPVYGLININTAPWRVLAALRLCPFDDAEVDASLKSMSTRFNINPLTQAVGSANSNTDNVPDNVRLAQAIASYRDLGVRTVDATSGQIAVVPNVASQLSAANATYPYVVSAGPFTSLDELLNVPAIQTYLQNTNFQKTSPEPDDVQGHFLSSVTVPPTLPPPAIPTSTPPSPTPYQVGSITTATPPTILTDGVRNDVEERFDLLSRLSNQCSVKSDVFTVYIVLQGWQNAGSTDPQHPPRMAIQRRMAFIIDRTNCTPTNSTPKIIPVPTN
jgi:hypothetical protein